MNIIMLGGPGAGKGTASTELSKDLKIVHISTGVIFREAIKNETELGKKIQDYMNRGVLVPDEIVNDVVKERLQAPDCANGVILDGFPRTKQQAEVLDRIFEESGKKLDAAIELSIPDEDIIKRLSGRRICSNKECGAIYNVVTRPPKVENVCDVCGSALYIRKDDNAETVKVRLEEYHRTSKDLLEYYRKDNRLKTVYPKIDSSVESLMNEIKKILEI